MRHDVIQRFIQEMSTEAKVHHITTYGARVTKLVKDGSEWRITWSTPQVGRESEIIEVKRESVSYYRLDHFARVDSAQCFDAVIVASGHYHAPRVPDIPGLSETKSKYGSRIMHSKEYRQPENFRNKVHFCNLGIIYNSTNISRPSL